MSQRKNTTDPGQPPSLDVFPDVQEARAKLVELQLKLAGAERELNELEAARAGNGVDGVAPLVREAMSLTSIGGTSQ